MFGIVENLQESKHALLLHEFGDLSEDCWDIQVVDVSNSSYIRPVERPVIANLGNIVSNTENDAVVDLVIKNITVQDLIGKSLVVYEEAYKEKSYLERLADRRLGCCRIEWVQEGNHATTSVSGMAIIALAVLLLNLL